MDRLLITLEDLENSPCGSQFELMWKESNHFITSLLFVPEFKAGTIRPCGKADFDSYRENVDFYFKNFNILLQKVYDLYSITEGRPAVSREFLTNGILLCGEHAYEDCWTTPVTLRYSKNIANLLRSFTNCVDPAEMITGKPDSEENHFRGLFKKLLTFIRPKLLKETWKCYPAAIAAYKWMLLQVKSPYLSDHLIAVLPTTLLLVDDFMLENRLIGFDCLAHIVENVTRTELTWNGHAEVIYGALYPLLHQREAEQVRPVVRCTISVLQVLHGRLCNEQDLQWSKWDDVLVILLQGMEQEQGLALREAYVDSLANFIEAMGLSIVRWSKRLLRILRDYLEIAGYLHKQTALPAIKCVNVYLKAGWPRVSHNADGLLSMLFRFLYDITSSVQSNANTIIPELSSENKKIVDLTKECVNIVCECAPEKKLVLKKELKDLIGFNVLFTKVILEAI